MSSEVSLILRRPALFLLSPWGVGPEFQDAYVNRVLATLAFYIMQGPNIVQEKKKKNVLLSFCFFFFFLKLFRRAWYTTSYSAF